MSSVLSRRAGWLFAGVSVALLATNALAFRHFADPNAGVPGRGDLSKHRVQLRAAHTLAAATSGHPRIARALGGYYELQELLRGAVVVVPPEIQVEVWNWRHVALADLRFEPVRGVARHRVDAPTQARITAGGATFVILANASEVRESRLVLIPTDPKTIHVVAESSLMELPRLGD